MTNTRSTNTHSASPAGALPVVSVVMPVHNGERFLAHAMNSILTQSLANLELIVVDDGSTDATGSIIEGYVREDERVQPIHQPHLGVVSARNTGCFASRAPLLAMLDSDDIASRDRLAIQVDFLEHNKQVALLGGSALVIEETGRELGVLRYPTAAEGLSAQLHSYNCILHSTVMMRTDIFRQLRGYRSPFSLAEDYDLFLRTADSNGIDNLPDTLSMYRLHDRQTTSSHIVQSVLCAIAAQVSAARRNAGQDDVSWLKDAITPESLVAAGQNQDVIERSVISAFTREIAKNLRRGCFENGQRLLAQAEMYLMTSGRNAIRRSSSYFI